MHIEEIIDKIKPLDENCMKLAQARFDALIKPVGSLAKLEQMVTRYAGVVGKHNKEELLAPKKALLVWCSIEQAEAAEKIMRGNWPVNILGSSVGADVHALLVVAEDLSEALEEGASLVQELISKEEYGMVGFGCLAAANDNIVQAAMAGGMLQAAAIKVPIMLDGVSTCKAALKAIQIGSNVKEYLLAGHVAAEAEAEEVLKELGLEAPLRLDIPDGAGEGATIAFSLFDAGIKAYREMETFEEAGVHDEMESFSRKVEKKGSHWQQECEAVEK